MLCFSKFFGHRSKITHCVVFSLRSNPIIYLLTNQKSTHLRECFLALAERGGFEPPCDFSQTDFESVRLLGSYRTILPQSRHILEVVFQLLNSSAALSSLLEFWRESQTRWRYYSTKTPKNQGVLRK